MAARLVAPFFSFHTFQNAEVGQNVRTVFVSSIALWNLIVLRILIMEATESPLDVLSRAATMVQDSSPPEYGKF
ncbi:hypothetical protein C0J52_12723 [Blattella germanica]|nr:hypothetical protein C0J52_12723 [Blattella germanica]